MYKIIRHKLEFNSNSHDNLSIVLPFGHRILAFGPDKQEVINTGKSFQMIDPYVDVMQHEEQDPSQVVKFIILPIGAAGINENLVRRRNLLGSFVATNGQKCYVFEGGMVGV